MLRDRLVAFLNLVREHPDLLIDLCTEPDLLSRAQVLALLERYGAPMHDKERLIKKLIEVDILAEESHGAFSVNPLVVKLVNLLVGAPHISFARAGASATAKATRCNRC